MTTTRRKSPRAPSLALEDALSKALTIYEKEGRHPAPADVVARHIGYKSANNGSALSAIASLKYFGLLERVKDGSVAVSGDVEEYKYAPEKSVRLGLLNKWLKEPQLFSTLLEDYKGRLPSDATLRFDLIRKRAFNPAAADSCVSVFLRSVEFVNQAGGIEEREGSDSGDQLTGSTAASMLEADPGSGDTQRELVQASSPPTDSAADVSLLAVGDRIPVRLRGGRRAWLEIPVPFYEADKELLRAQISLLITNDDEE